jgi:hypothetical protein
LLFHYWVAAPHFGQAAKDMKVIFFRPERAGCFPQLQPRVN